MKRVFEYLNNLNTILINRKYCIILLLIILIKSMSLTQLNEVESKEIIFQNITNELEGTLMNNHISVHNIKFKRDINIDKNMTFNLRKETNLKVDKEIINQSTNSSFIDFQENSDVSELNSTGLALNIKTLKHFPESKNESISIKFSSFILGKSDICNLNKKSQKICSTLSKEEIFEINLKEYEYKFNSSEDINISLKNIGRVIEIMNNDCPNSLLQDHLLNNNFSFFHSLIRMKNADNERSSSIEIIYCMSSCSISDIGNSSDTKEENFVFSKFTYGFDEINIKIVPTFCRIFIICHKNFESNDEIKKFQLYRSFNQNQLIIIRNNKLRPRILNSNTSTNGKTQLEDNNKENDNSTTINVIIYSSFLFPAIILMIFLIICGIIISRRKSREEEQEILRQRQEKENTVKTIL